MKTLMTMLIALLLWTGSVYANGYDDALEVYLGYQDVYASLGTGQTMINTQKSILRHTQDFEDSP